jgi:hypothetical protein
MKLLVFSCFCAPLLDIGGLKIGVAGATPINASLNQWLALRPPLAQPAFWWLIELFFLGNHAL